MAISVPARIAMMTGFSVVFLLGFFGNICVVLVILTSKRFRKSIPSILVTNLALADFSVCMVSAPYFVSSLLIEQPEKPGRSCLNSVCKAFVVTAYSLGFTRILLLTIISVERFIAIIHPFFYQRYCTAPLPNLRVTLLCCYPWVHSFVTTSPAGFMSGWVRYEGKVGKHCGYHWENANLGFVLPLIFLNFFIPLFTIVYTNCKVYLTARRQRRRIAACFRVASPTEASRTSCIEESFAARAKIEACQEKILSLSSTEKNNDDNGFKISHFYKRFESNAAGGAQKNGHCVTAKFTVVEFQESSLRSGDHLMNLPPKINIKEGSSSSIKRDSMQVYTSRATKKVSKAVNSDDESSIVDSWSNDDRVSAVTICQQGPFQSSLSSKMDDSGFRDDPLEKSSCLSSSKTLKNATESKRGSSFFGVDSLIAARKHVDRFMQLSRARRSRDVGNSDNRRKTKDFVVFFSTLSVVTLFLCTWLPFAIVSIVLISNSAVSEETDLLVSMITVIDSAFTPFIVLGTRREFRKKLLQTLCRLRIN